MAAASASGRVRSGGDDDAVPVGRRQMAIPTAGDAMISGLFEPSVRMVAEKWSRSTA